MGLRRELESKIEEFQKYLEELDSGDENLQCESMADVTERVAAMPKMPKMETGISSIDYRMYGGLSLGSFINMAGENFAGKTTLLLAILKNICAGNKALFFSFEMYEVLLSEKMKEWSNAELENLLIEQKRNTLSDIEKLIIHYAEKGVKLFAIDSRMKILVEGNKEDYQKNSKISQTLSKLCQELGIIIIVINQIAETDQRNKRLSLKGSGDQAYDSDVIFYITVDLDKNTGDVKSRKLICSKDRINGRRWIEELPNFDDKPIVIEYNEDLPQL